MKLSHFTVVNINGNFKLKSPYLRYQDTFIWSKYRPCSELCNTVAFLLGSSNLSD